MKSHVIVRHLRVIHDQLSEVDVTLQNQLDVPTKGPRTERIRVHIGAAPRASRSPFGVARCFVGTAIWEVVAHVEISDERVVAPALAVTVVGD